MKGYELYSWQEEGQWHFTLITGTNRNKTLEEITTGENIESKDGWVNIHVVGVEEIKDVLSRVPENEWVFWTGGWFVNPPEPATIQLILPPEDIVNEITHYAEGLSLDFHVADF
jgi:hypothetical protein